MAYMVYQQFTNAVMAAYDGDPTATAQLQPAVDAKQWVQQLKIDPAVRDPLVEQLAALEEGFRRLAARSPGR